MKQLYILSLCIAMLLILLSCGKNDSFSIDPEHRLDELIDKDDKPDSNIDKRIPATIESIQMISEDMGLNYAILWLPGQYLVNKAKLFFDTTNSQYRFYIDELEIENKRPNFYYQQISKLNKIGLRVQNVGISDSLRLDGSYTSGKWCQLVVENIKSGAKYLYETKDIDATYYSMFFDPVFKTFRFYLRVEVFDYNNKVMKTFAMLVFVKF